MAGRFIVFEGTDGAGKSEMLKTTREHLVSKGINAVFLRDPGGTAIGDALRQTLLNPEFSRMTPLTELLLYSASRNQLVTELIIPALEHGELVICDRFFYSTLAYQGATGNIAEELLNTITRAGADNLIPDNVVFLDLPAEVGLARLTGSRDRIEEKGIAYMKSVRTRYQQVLATLPAGVLQTIDAAASLETVKRRVVEYLDELL